MSLREGETNGSVSLASDQVQRLLQCAVCLDRFKQPKLLPCQHTFCLFPCLEGLVHHRTRSIRCPECRADHFLPRAGLASLPNNLTIIGFISLADINGSQPQQAGVQPTSDELNEGDSDSLSRREDNADQVNGEEHTHSTHQNRIGTTSGCYVCQNSTTPIQRCCHCEQLVCDPCHQQHTRLVRSELGRSIELIRHGLPQITDQVAMAKRKDRHLHNRCDSVKTEITEGVEKLIRELKSRERVLHEEVDSFLSGELRGLKIFQENAEREIASLSSFCDATDVLLGESRHRAPIGELMETKRQCDRHVETVQSYEDDSISSPTVRAIQLSFESPFLSSTISNLGELILTNNRRSNIRVATEQHDGDWDVNQDTWYGTNSVPSGDTNRSASYNMENGFFNNRMNSTEPSEHNTMGDSIGEAATSGIGRNLQVTFADNDPDSYNETGSTLDSSLTYMASPLRNFRRNRYDRLSDTYLIASRDNMSSLSRQILNRRRHQSLGALRPPEELDDGYFQHETSPIQGINRRRQDAEPRETSSNLDSNDRNRIFDGASSYPGTRNDSELFDRYRPIFPRQNGILSYTRSSQPFQGSSMSSNLPSTNIQRTHVAMETPRNRYNQKGNVIKHLGTRGSDVGQFMRPHGVVASHLDDRIYVADSGNNRVQIFDSNGHSIKSFGHYGQNNGEFDCLAGIAITNLGQIVVSDRCNHRIQIFDRNGNFQHCFGSEGSGVGELKYPLGVACDNMSFIYVCDKENHRVQVFQSNGRFVRMIGEHGSGIGQLENPHDVTISQDNKIYVTDSSTNQVRVFSIYGDFLFSFGVFGSLPGQMNSPRGIAVDSQGFVVLADGGNNRIQIFRSDGRFFSMFGNWGSDSGQFKGLEAVAILADGNIIASDREKHTVQIF